MDGRRGWLGRWITALLITPVHTVLAAIVGALVPTSWSGLRWTRRVIAEIEQNFLRAATAA